MFNSSTNNNPSIKGRKIQVPLNFWFTKNPSLALPLLKMQNIEILLEIETNPKVFTDYIRYGVIY